VNGQAAPEDCTPAEKPDPRDNLSGDPIGRSAAAADINRHHRQERRAEGDQNVRAQARRLLVVLTLYPDRGSEASREQQPQHDVSSRHINKFEDVGISGC
jgi:hypothetical protein